MRTPSDLPPRRRSPRARRRWFAGRGRLVVIVLLGLVVLVFLSARSLSGFYVDYLWFDSLGRADVFWTTLGAKATLVAMFSVGFAVAAFISLLIADRLRPMRLIEGPEEQFVMCYRELVGRRTGLVRIAVAVLLGLLMGLPAMSQWQPWLLFRNAQQFGIDDPLFGADVGFYVFRLPFLSYLVDWLFAAMILIAIVTAAAHYVNGAIRFQTTGERINRPARVHLTILFALIALLKAADYWLQRFELTVSTRGVVHGATYTDVKAELPALNLLILVSLLVVVLFLVGIRYGGWRLPALAMALWAVVAIVAGAVYPAIIQRFVVQPNVTTRERPYIEDHLVATKAAMDIDDVDVVPLQLGPVAASDVEADPSPLRDVRLLEPTQMRDRFSLDQGLFAFYAINDLDVDRYQINGREQQAMLAARELNAAGIPNRTWVSQHLIYTHGCGLVTAPASQVTSDGRPVYYDLDITRPELYMGQGLGAYAIVNTEQAEQSCPGVDIGPYTGDAGVRLDSTLRRIAFAVHFGEYNLFGSRLVGDNSRLIHVRDIRDRVHKVAPFLHLDADPYPVAIDGEIVWIVDGFTTTSRYPYSQRANTDQLPAGSGLDHTFNYVRNSVKAVVDAYDGSVTLYLVDPNDPIAVAWSKAYPDLFSGAEDVPDELREHFRYPEDLFRVQTNLYGRYQFDDADQFFNRDAAWSVAQAPPVEPEGANNPTDDTTTSDGGASTDRATQADTGDVAEANVERFEPYYTLFHAPGESGVEPTFSLLRPFVPFSSDDTRKELRGFMVVSSEPDSYGELVVYELSEPLPPGPATVAAELESNPTISPVITQLDLRGSRVIFGDLQVVPVADGLVYVRPLFVRPDDEGSRQVFVRRVMALYGNRSAIDESLSGAVSLLFPGFDEDLGDIVDTGANPEDPDEPDEPDEPSEDPAELLLQADALFDEADLALRQGDLGTYQQKMNEAQALVERAIGLLAPQPSDTTAPTDTTDTTDTTDPTAAEE